MAARLSLVGALVIALAGVPDLVTAQGGRQGHEGHHAHDAARAQQSPADSDSVFAALQARGKVVMGVDQYASVHRFDALPDGGRIELRRPGGDSTEVRTIREHLRRIARQFSAGDVQAPDSVHRQRVPGSAVMAAKRSTIRYVYRPLPDGGEVRISTSDPEALRAIHEFMAFQRRDHRAGGRP